uniref:Uncharacterized protein n=1 Tax=Romanomermis culicivorax TaxID=13658 RepID=A0A915J1Q1_ROMCU
MLAPAFGAIEPYSFINAGGLSSFDCLIVSPPFPIINPHFVPGICISIVTILPPPGKFIEAGPPPMPDVGELTILLFIEDEDPFFIGGKVPPDFSIILSRHRLALLRENTT